MMSPDEQKISVANRMYECRRAAHTLLGPRYSDVVGPYERMIQQVSTAKNQDVVQTAAHMAKEVTDPMVRIFLMAAVVDICDPPQASS
jgi:hypothetical protein